KHPPGGPGLLDRRLRCGRLIWVLAVQPQTARLRDGQAMLQRELLDRGGLQLHAATGRAIGLRQDQRNLKAGAIQALERHPCELRGSREDDAQLVEISSGRWER